MSPLPPESPESPFPEVLLRSGRTSYEFVQWLGPARHGDLILARRRFDESISGYSVIKRPWPAGSEEARRRLMDEARVSSLFYHPNLLAAWHLRGPDDTPHLLLEHVPAYRLETVLEASERAGQPLSEALACYVVAEVADALHHAHTLEDEHGRELGVIHRDVTPHNILIGKHGQVKLQDFGAAWSRLSGRVGSEGPALQGSLAYAAPEHVQMLGLDGRADQFSLGIVLLQLLTGRHLFEGAERFDARQRRPSVPQGDAMLQCARELTERIRDYSVGELEAATRAVPEALRPIVHRMLAPEREERFASCAQLSRTLRDALRDSGRHFGRHEILGELATLNYVAQRIAAGDAPEEAVQQRHLSDVDAIPRSAPRLLAIRRGARLRGTPRRR